MRKAVEALIDVEELGLQQNVLCERISKKKVEILV